MQKMIIIFPPFYHPFVPLDWTPTTTTTTTKTRRSNLIWYTQSIFNVWFANWTVLINWTGGGKWFPYCEIGWCCESFDILVFDSIVCIIFYFMVNWWTFLRITRIYFLFLFNWIVRVKRQYFSLNRLNRTIETPTHTPFFVELWNIHTTQSHSYCHYLQIH